MQNNILFKIGLAFGIICFLIMMSFPVTVGDTTHYEDCVVLIVGRCNTVTGPILWRHGLFVPKIKRSITIEANGEDGEGISIFIRNHQIGIYFDNENIKIKLNQVKGVFYWGGKSLLFNNDPPLILARCIAEDMWITN